MRKMNIYTPAICRSRNELIDCANAKKEVFLLSIKEVPEDELGITTHEIKENDYSTPRKFIDGTVLGLGTLAFALSWWPMAILGAIVGGSTGKVLSWVYGLILDDRNFWNYDGFVVTEGANSYLGFVHRTRFSNRYDSIQLGNRKIWITDSKRCCRCGKIHKKDEPREYVCEKCGSILTRSKKLRNIL